MGKGEDRLHPSVAPIFERVGRELVTPNLCGSLFGSFSRLTPNLTVGLGDGEDQESQEKHHGRGMDPG